MSKSYLAFSLVELVIVMGLIALMFTIIILVLNPYEIYTKSRDLVRVADVSSIVLAVEEYRSVNKVYPGEDSVLYTSTDKEKLLAIQASNGWIPSDLSKFIQKLPIDPINTGENIYRYKRVNDTYEIDAKLVIDTDKNTNDSGNNSLRFEMGNNLSVLN